MKHRVVAIYNTKTEKEIYCIEKKLLFGWFPDWNFYSPYSTTREEAYKKLDEATSKIIRAVIRVQ